MSVCAGEPPSVRQRACLGNAVRKKLCARELGMGGKGIRAPVCACLLKHLQTG